MYEPVKKITTLKNKKSHDYQLTARKQKLHENFLEQIVALNKLSKSAI